MEKTTEDGYRVHVYRSLDGWRCRVTPPSGLGTWTLTPIAALAEAKAESYEIVEEMRKARAAPLAATGAA